MKKILSIVILSLFFSVAGYSQGDWNTIVTYNMGIPLGNTADFIGNTSFRGFMVEGDYFLEDEWTVGFITGIQTFYEEKGVQTRLRDNLTATGEEFRYLNSIPILVSGKYHFDRYNPISAHIGLGAGLYNMIETVEFAGIAFENRNWQIGFMPEIGVGFEMSPATHFFVAAQYNYYLESKDILSQSYIGINAGLRFLP